MSATSPLSDVEREQLIDRRVMRRLATDSAYRNAASAEEQAEREDAITREEEQRLEAVGVSAVTSPVLERCDYCGGDAVPGSTCPRAVACPTCRSAAGSPCYRPSGHRAMVIHAERIAAAEELDAAAGIRYELVDEPLELELEV